MACDFMEVCKSSCNNLLTVWMLLARCFLLPAAKHVTACDFMEVSIAEVRRKREALGDVSFMLLTAVLHALLFSAARSQTRDGLRFHGSVRRGKQATARGPRKCVIHGGRRNRAGAGVLRCCYRRHLLHFVHAGFYKRTQLCYVLTLCDD
jgi:hypothetical protein